MGRPTIYPTGTTIYNPEKAWNGYTLFPIDDIGAVLIDMNGRVVKNWKDFQGFPNKLLPGGYCMGSLGVRDAEYSYQDQTDVAQVDWDGNVFGNLTRRNTLKTKAKNHNGWRVSTMTINVKGILSATMFRAWNVKPKVEIR